MSRHSEKLVQVLPVLPLRDQVVFPGMTAVLEVGRPASLALLQEVLAVPRAHFLTAVQKNPEVDEPAADDLHPIGVEVEVKRLFDRPDGRFTVAVLGVARRRLEGFTQPSLYLCATAAPVDEIDDAGPEVDELAGRLRTAIEQLSSLARLPAPEADLGPGGLADHAATHLDIKTSDRVALLAELSVTRRLERVLAVVRQRLDAYAMKEKFAAESEKESAGRHEQILRERMKRILAELGEEDQDEKLPEFAEQIDKAGMPPEVEQAARRQLRRLRTTAESSPEYTVGRTYLEWLVELPWSKRSDDRLDLAEARAILDADHHGLDKVKKRVLEYLAVRKLKPQKKGPILCLVGPPGVGKTSLGKSVARALGREFVRASLGGVSDESEIRGHRRTYIGALPGRIIQTIRRAGTKNPVFLLDEIDKLGSDFRGDPSSALLEVLDPEQNNSFSDHYLEVPFDLSEVIFIATANDLSAIPGPLRDRMEVLAIPGYPLGEKRLIAERFLIPKQVGEHGLTPDSLTFTGPAIEAIVERYTREAGVRNLEREIASVVRAVAVKVVSSEDVRAEIRLEDLADYLGPAKFFEEVAEQTQQPGVATGLAWTPSGGEILFIEVSRMPGTGRLVLTGQLGDVMKESAQAALSYVRSHAAQWSIPPEVFERSDVHIHVPAGATPKDGPSAGNAIVTAIVSRLTGRRVLGEVAMTGEITLRGTVLPVGGIASKVMAAHRAGIKRVILPERNEKDLVDIPAEVRAALEVVLVKRVDETLEQALAKETSPPIEFPFWRDAAVAQHAMLQAA